MTRPRCRHVNTPSALGDRDARVRLELAARYEELARQYPQKPEWRDRLEAVRAGDVLVEPGWMLAQIVGDGIDVFGMYRVYPDGRIERDRYIERAEERRFRGAAD